MASRKANSDANTCQAKGKEECELPRYKSLRATRARSTGARAVVGRVAQRAYVIGVDIGTRLIPDSASAHRSGTTTAPQQQDHNHDSTTEAEQRTAGVRGKG